jgi:hypothetical protein
VEGGFGFRVWGWGWGWGGMEEKEDVRLEMVPLKEGEVGSSTARNSTTNLIDFDDGEGDVVVVMGVDADVDGGVDSRIDIVEGMGTAVRDDPEMMRSDQGEAEVEKVERVGGLREIMSRDLARVQKSEVNEAVLRESLLSETRTSLLHNEMATRGVGLVSDEDFDREFGASASGGSGQSTPKRRNGSRGRSTGASRMENGVEGGGGSFKESVLKGSLIDALKANAVDLSPRSRLSGKDHGITFLEEEAVADLRPTTSNPIFITIMKTLFYVLVWYTFSTCLTL